MSPAETAQLFAAMGDATRLALIGRLGEGASSIVRLSDGTAMTRQAVTKHLHVLEKAGLVQQQRQGRESLWSLQRQRLDEARSYLDQVSRQWDARLDRLKSFVED